MAFGAIKGEESSTVTFKAATITQTRNTTNMHQELVTLADPASSLGVARVLAAPMASTEFGLGVRIISGPSSAADFVVRPAFSSTAADNPVTATQSGTWSVAQSGTWNMVIASHISSATPAAGSSGLIVQQVGYVAPSTTVSVAAFPANSSQVEVTKLPAGLLSTSAPAANSSGLNVWLVNQSTIVTIAALPAGSTTVTATLNLGALASTVAPSSGSSGLIVRQVWDNRLTVASTNAFASSAFTINSSGAGVNIYVTAYSITSTAAGPRVVKFYSSNTMTWPVVLAAVSSAISGANLAASPYLFRTKNAAEAMTLNVGSSIAGYHVAVSYFLAP